MPVSTRESRLGCVIGRAVSAWGGRAAPDTAGHPTILIVGAGCWPFASRALTGAAGAGFSVVISAEQPDSGWQKPINAGILLVCLPPQNVAELQSMVNSDPGVLLTVDIYRQDVRARGRRVGRFETPPFWCCQPIDGLAGRLLMARRLLGAAELAGDDRARLQRRFAAICDAMKAPRTDTSRTARRLDRLLADLTARGKTGLS